MLDSLGHHNVAVLDGGIAGWVDAGGSLETEAPVYPPAELNVDDHWSGVITRAELIERLGRLVVLDGRAPERYRGEIEPIDPVAGHVPTAHSLPVTGNLDAGGRFRHPAELRERLHWVSHEASGMDGGRDASGHATGVVAYCGSGVNACHNILAMRLAGLPAPLLYAGSFSDWSRAGLPVATGPEPGERPATL
jgi:thiosulfate/3-mercaptopyruvate sulfurtransferase